MQHKQVFNHMTPYKPGKQIEDVKEALGLTRIVKLASNENPFGCSKSVKDILLKATDHLEIYPDGYASQLRKRISEDLKVAQDQLVFGCGSDEVIDMICRVYLEKGTRAVMPSPTFPQYKHNALIQGAEVKEVPLVDGYHDLEGMLQAINDDTRVVFLCSPNNPTGCVIDRLSFENFLSKCKKDVLIVMDEAYYEYITEKDIPDSISYLQNHQNLVVLRTFSKAYGLAGLRIGFGVCALEVANVLNIARGPFNTTKMAQLAAEQAYIDQDFINMTVSKTNENKKMFMACLDRVGLKYYDSETNFVLVKLKTSGDALYEYLLTKGFIVRSGEALGVPNSVRITIGEKHDMEEMSEHIASFLTMETTGYLS